MKVTVGRLSSSQSHLRGIETLLRPCNRGRNHDTPNRTLEELKLQKTGRNRAIVETPNRTLEELKL